MPDKTFLVTLPDGKTMGPLSLSVMKQFVVDGDIPVEATIEHDGKMVRIADILGSSGGRGRMSSEARADLAGTRASTPMALLAEAQRKTT